MKRYWLFMYSEYYPRGGMNDYQGSYDSIEACRKKIIEVNEGWEHEYYHILDVQEGVIVEMSEYQQIRSNITIQELYKENNPE